MRSSFVLSSLLASATAFHVTPLPPVACRRSSLAVRASLDEPAEPEKPSITMAGIEEFRERQRLKAEGKPLSVWSKTLDRKDAPVVEGPPEGQDGYTAPTQQQKQAADALFEKVLRTKDTPDGFGEGLDKFSI